MSLCIIYITAPSLEEAEIIGRHLVSKRLAACVNIINNMESIYHWEGKVETASEVIVIAKTKEALIDEITESLKSIHSYKCPAIMALPIIGGSDTFLDYIRSETK